MREVIDEVTPIQIERVKREMNSMLASVINHSTKKIVIHLSEEPIVQQYGQTKNHYEINTAIRLFDKTRTRHVDLKFISFNLVDFCHYHSTFNTILLLRVNQTMSVLTPIYRTI